ncbi:MAG TPA: DUF1800 domain-containing protein [Verrucomicrobiae bacterium]|jgi:uncharacterized protein (DUF1800 family)
MLNPLPTQNWNYETATHLLNRAGFGGTPQEIQNLTKLGPDQAIASLLDYEKIPDKTADPTWAHPDPQYFAALRQEIKAAKATDVKGIRDAENHQEAARILELRGWWLNRMAYGPRPFQEKMTLFWHGHFATSIEKVRQAPNSAYLMWRQNELFRRLATDNWLRLMIEAGRDPAMLVWLDQWQSRKEHPNENYARESMELFSLGEGHYTEKDVTEAARALTGWSYVPEDSAFVYRPAFHDDGTKTILGLTGQLTGEDFLAQVIRQPQATLFITAKIWNFFAGQMPSPELNQALANVLTDNGNVFKPFLRTMFRSEEFYSDSIVRNAVKSPVQWLVGSARMLQCQLPPPFISTAILRGLGQDLLAPPNVKGWDGGMSWITTNTLLDRYNDATTIVNGTAQQLSPDDFARKPGGNGGDRLAKLAQHIHVGGVDVDKILTTDECADKNMLVNSLEHRLLQSSLSEDQEKGLRDFLHSKTVLTNSDILTAVRLVMSTPEYQVV